MGAGYIAADAGLRHAGERRRIDSHRTNRMSRNKVFSRVDRLTRTWNLRREWSRSFAIMLGFIVVAGGMSIVGMRTLVGEVETTARQLNRESVAIASVRSALLAHEEVAHELLGGLTVDRPGFVLQQQVVLQDFAAATAAYPAQSGLRPAILAARNSWRHGLESYGLWGNEIELLHGDHVNANRTFGASSDRTVGLLDALSLPSLAVMNRGLVRSSDLEQNLVVGLLALFGMAALVTIHFRRRMIKDLVRPVAGLTQGVLRFRAGDYDQPITVARQDELGELAEAFNAMANEVHDTHLALELRATHDVLTGLPNRAALTERLEASFRSNRDRRSRTESVLFIDIDDFKDVNNVLGHAGGDALLIQLAARLNDCVRPYDLVTRLGGDEFAIVVVEDDTGISVEVAERILETVRNPFEVNGARLHVSVSIGIAPRDTQRVDAAELLNHADFAMYLAKGAGKGRYQLFDAQIYDSSVARTALKAELTRAITHDQLRIDYQPVAGLPTGGST